jgi:hypothetical protein
MYAGRVEGGGAPLGGIFSQLNKRIPANKTMNRRRSGLTILSLCFHAQQAFMIKT